MATITKDTRISNLMEEHPATRAVFAAHGMGCLSCMGAPDETVESSACMHGLPTGQLLAELEQAIQKESIQ